MTERLVAATVTSGRTGWNHENECQRRVLKVFHEPTGLQARLPLAGWEADIRATPNFLIYGSLVTPLPNEASHPDDQSQALRSLGWPPLNATTLGRRER